MVTVFGVPIQSIRRKEVLERCRIWLHGEGQHHIITANPEILVKARSNPSFHNILSNADLVVADGVGVRWATFFLQQPSCIRFFQSFREIFFKSTGAGPIPERITGSDIIESIAREARNADVPAFCIGGFKGTAVRAAESLQKRIGGLDISGYERDHTASIIPSDDLSDMLFQKKPAVVFVGYGAPIQEQWIFHNLHRFPFIKIAIGVGGALDYLAGNTHRAPSFYQKHGIEWLWRGITQPRRIPRIIRATVYFPLLIFASAVRGGYDTNHGTKKHTF